MLERFFGRRKKKKETEPAIFFGRYSDNNKPVEKVNRWIDADNLLKKKNIHKASMLFLNISAMIPWIMSFMNVTKVMDAFNFTRAQKLFAVITITSICRLR